MRLGPLPGGRPVTAPLWLDLNRALIAKTIAELAFEEALVPEPIDRAGTQWLLRLDGEVAYRFRAARRIWGNLAIDPASLTRVVGALQATEARVPLIISGLISIALGLWVLFNLGTATLTLLGVLVGVQTLLEGLTLITVGRLRPTASAERVPAGAQA